MVPNSLDGGEVTSDQDYALLDALVNGSPEALIAISPEGLVLFWNRGAESLFGFTSAEAQRRPLFDLVVPPDRLQETRDALQAALRNGHASGESIRRRKDGSLVPVEVLMNVIRDPSGNVAFIAVSERNISARMRAYDALHTFSSIVQYSDDAIISESLEGTILSWNSGAVRMYGYTAEEAVGRPITILAPSDRNLEPFELLGRIRRGERVEHYSTVRRKKDGTCIEVSATISPIRDIGGIITGASLIARDVTEEKLLRKQIDEIGSQRAEDLRRFVTSVQKAQEEERHRISRELHDDLGQRLTGLKLKLAVLEDEISGSSARNAGTLRAITEEIDAMMTDVKRISSNLRPAELDDFGLVSALNFLCRNFQKMCNIRVSFQPGPARLYGKDIEIALYRIAQEALANVARHSGAGTVSVKLSHDGEAVGLSVEDDGGGFDVAAVRVRQNLHPGLGLISMKERAQMFGGSMYLTASPGGGTRVHVEIPLKPEGIHEKNKDTHRR
jgi:two-component system sensor histidine kinase UhpB